MRRADRLFEIIQTLRSASGPLTAATIAEELEVSVRTVYRDVAALQAMRVPIDGEAGIGYLLRAGYDLPPLNFDTEELEAIVVGLSLLDRTGDRSLKRAAQRVTHKIEALTLNSGSLKVSDWGAPTPERVDLAELRGAIREERKLQLTYRDGTGAETERKVLPIAITYFVEVVVMTAWCELREDFRNFRADRIAELTLLDERFDGQGASLRARWEAAQGLAATARP